MYLQDLLELIGPHTECRTISLEKRTLACLWVLANKEAYRSTADRFGIAKGSLHYYLMNFCRLLTEDHILSHIIQWPTSEREFRGSVEKFSERAGFPGVVGAIDGTHIPILGPGPTAFRDSYICRKGFPAIQLQGVCDTNLMFVDVFCAYPGSVHDARVYKSSPLYNRLQTQPLPDRYLLGDSAYGLDGNMIVPYRDNGHLTPEQKRFNFLHSSTRVDIERCFGLLKGKFRRLKFLDMKKVRDIPHVIVACCVLHNFIIMRESYSVEDIVVEPEVDCRDEGIESVGRRGKTGSTKRDDIKDLLA
jgi:hypothetical protein